MTFIRFCLLIALVLTSHEPVYCGTPPKLIVVVSFDQYRGDYPQMFAGVIGTRGFARIQREGVSYSACSFEHANNITGPGHAALLTGNYPYRSGIVGNNFCDVRTNACTYCASDSIGTLDASQLESPTLGDVLRARDRKSKVVAVSLKDRAGILMAGKQATACVWFNAATKKWETSSSYRIPTWLKNMNVKVSANVYAGKTWKAQIPASSSPALDDVMAEGLYPGGNNTFPHVVLKKSDPKFMMSVLLSPFSMDMVFDAAAFALREEKLGKDNAPDVLCIGVSTTDYVGHNFGPNSLEVQELYRLADLRIAQLIDDLDTRVGRNNYVLVVTSDHGVAPIPEVIRNLPQQQGEHIDAGRIRDRELVELVDSALTKTFGVPSTRSYVRKIYEPSIYLNDTAIANRDRSEVLRVAVEALRKHHGLMIVATKDTLALGDCPNGADEAMCRYVRNSFHAARTGDIVIYPRRYWIIGANVATHGTPHDYDRSVVLMMLGSGIKPQTSSATVSPVDIAPTLAKLLGLTMGVVDGKELPLK